MLIQINDQKKQAISRDINNVKSKVNEAEELKNKTNRKSGEKNRQKSTLMETGAPVEKIQFIDQQILDYTKKLRVVVAKITEFKRQIKVLANEWINLENRNKILSKSLSKKEKVKEKKKQIIDERSTEDTINGAK